MFVDDSCDGLRFVPNPEPTNLEVIELLASIRRRITRLARRGGIDLDRPEREIESVDPIATDSPVLSGICGASVVGRIATGSRAGQAVVRIGRASAAALVTSGGARHAHSGGFDLHANVAVPAGDRDRLEHLCGYVLRPPVAQRALQLTGEGKILLAMRRPWHDGTRAILFEPHELIERLCALIPKPRINLLLYHGVLGPAARRRRAAVYAARGAEPPRPAHAASAAAAESASPPIAPAPTAARGCPRQGAMDSVPARANRDVSDVPPTRPRSPRRAHAPWADLLRRTFGIDILDCPGCGGRLRFLATLEDPRVVRKILDHLSLPTDLLDPVPARSPPWHELPLPGLGDWPEN